ncbi:hypothetical protein I3842_02G053800 [Carya illinoinensis]|uniref:Uncharacterized protein n=1 Tax=Carya illinoinensis TaxID=32201 RepID=A0A922FP60_CARIL|nr:hypothetical protein I3842_02G053800 [Carya illinoinensis]
MMEEMWKSRRLHMITFRNRYSLYMKEKFLT